MTEKEEHQSFTVEDNLLIVAVEVEVVEEEEEGLGDQEVDKGDDFKVVFICCN